MNKYLELVAFKHTLFGLPITLLACFLAPVPFSLVKLIGIVIAFTAARTAGMALNRLFDEAVDRKNPRTASRALPQGLITRKQVKLVAFLSLGVFFITVCFFPWGVIFLAPLIIALLFFYSLAKRATPACHFILGAIEFFAPFCAWWAYTGSVGITAYLLGLGICFWITGIDLIYALQDVAFDRAYGVFSYPAIYGQKSALILSRFLHILAIITLFLAGLTLHAAWSYFVSTLVIASLLLLQHLQIAHPKAFFRYNSAISLCLLTGSLIS